MSMFRDFLRGMAYGLGNASAVREAVPQPRQGLLDQLCQQVGWVVDERDGKGGICLLFNGRNGSVQKLRIKDSGDEFVCFACYSDAWIPAPQVDRSIMVYLLSQNLRDAPFGGWGMCEDHQGDVNFHVYYPAPRHALDAPTFKFICEALVIEAAEFDDKLREAGRLR
jgi:hypothetical protein